MTIRRRPRLLASLAAGVLAAAACGGSGIPDAQLPNTYDTALVYAATGTAIGMASGFDILNATTARLELGESFDFVFDIDTAGTPVLLPSAVLGVGSAAGIRRPDRAYAETTKAPVDGYVTDSAFPLAADTEFLARSRASSQFCAYYVGALPRYGKFRVLELNTAERWVRLEMLVNLNCGYRSLEEGIPTS